MSVSKIPKRRTITRQDIDAFMELEAEVRRMLADPRARLLVDDFDDNLT